jgi:IS4 transposase
MRDMDAYLQLSQEEFAADCYRADFFVSAKKTAEMEACRKNMEQRWEWAKEDRSRRDFQGVSFCYLFAAYNVLYNAFVPEVLEKNLCRH